MTRPATDAVTVLERIRHPIVQAPMGGGLSTVALAAAVSDAGGLGFLAAGYRTAAQVEQEVAELRKRTRSPFGVNVFVPPREPADPGIVAAYVQRLEPVADRFGVALGEPRSDDDDWDAKLALLRRAEVPVASFVFGCPPADVVAELRAAGVEVWVTVTDPVEARVAAEAGADALVAQGYEAGAHRAAFDDAAPADPLGLLALLQLVAGETRLPVVAAGGIATGGAVAAVLCAGATAAQIGTAFLRCPEAGTSPPHRAAVASERPTRLTRAFTGRQARGIVNDFLERHGAEAPSAYPEVHHATAPVRAAARAAGDGEFLHLWAGQAHRLAREEPAGALVERLAAEAAAAVDAGARRLGAAAPA
ncbi:MAG TPA: nitronate monooxygenase [Solirubrobacteraceae bacterium]|nr:nitronate monooxygenase [Solirubrobacteraceae bacterium]